MGDRCYLSFEIRGHVAGLYQLQEICKALKDEYMHCESGNYGSDDFMSEFANALIHNHNPGFYEEECNYANIDALEGVMQELGIAYCVSHGAGGEYGPGVWSWCPAFGRNEATQGHDTGSVLELSAVKACVDDPTALRKLIVEAERAEGVGLPNFTVGEEVRQHFAPLIAKQALGVS